MPLRIEEMTGSISALMIAQTEGAVSAAQPIGTANLMNCTGIVIHQAFGTIGAVAHVEARSDAKAYLSDIKEAIRRLMAEMQAIQPSQGRLAFVIFGNNAGGNADYDQKLANIILESGGLGRVNKFDITDLRRNATGAALMQRGLNTTPVVSCVYDPKAETLYLGRALSRVLPVELDRSCSPMARRVLIQGDAPQSWMARLVGGIAGRGT